MRFQVTIEMPGTLQLSELAERHANDLWIPAHLDSQEAATFEMDHFRRQIAVELEMIELVAVTTR